MNDDATKKQKAFHIWQDSSDTGTDLCLMFT